MANGGGGLPPAPAATPIAPGPTGRYWDDCVTLVRLYSQIAGITLVTDLQARLEAGLKSNPDSIWADITGSHNEGQAHWEIIRHEFDKMDHTGKLLMIANLVGYQQELTEAALHGSSVF